MDIAQFTKLSNYLTHPLVLIGFTLFLLFALFQLVIKAKLIPQLTQAEGAYTLNMIISYGFIISITVVVFGFGWQFYKSGTEETIAELETRKVISALHAVLLEMGNNVISLTVLIEAIESAEFGGYTKTSPRRPNETELAHRERIKNQYRDYLAHIDQHFDAFKITMDSFHAYRNTLASLKKDSLQNIEKFYDGLKDSYESILSYKSDTGHCISLNYSDAEMSSCLSSKVRIRISNTKALLCNAYSYLCLLADVYPNVLRSRIPVALYGVSLTAGKQCAIEFRGRSADYFREKAEAYKDISDKLSGARLREIERRVNDPFLLSLRKLNGLGDELSEAEIWALEKKTLSPEKDDPVKLLGLASSSFMEGDGRHTKIYLERAKACQGVGPKEINYLDASIRRIDNPDMFGESLGIMVMEIEDGGLFQEAGIMEGDIIYELNGEPLHEPEEISRTLGWSPDHSFLLTIRRGERTITKPVTPGRSAGALTWVLVKLYQSRL